MGIRGSYSEGQLAIREDYEAPAPRRSTVRSLDEGRAHGQSNFASRAALARERGRAWAHEQMAQEAAYQADADIRKQQSEADAPWIAARRAMGSHR